MNTHGHATFTWEENLLVVNVFGPFNEEGIIEVDTEYLSAVKNNAFSHFHVLEIWDAEALGPPVSIHMVAEFWKTLINHNCLSIAIVVSNRLQRTLCEQSLPSDIGKIFTCKTSAYNWLKQRQQTMADPSSTD